MEIKDLKMGDEVYFEYWGGWRDYWSKLTEENKKIIQEIPNFDPEVFFDITGIDVREDNEDGKQ